MDHPTSTHVLTARVPVALEAPDALRQMVAEVLEGEYEAGLSGEGLTVLDIGANVGSFAVWADLRWPGSTIHAFEPHPRTFAMLCRNVAGRANVHPRNAAVYPGAAERLSFFARFAGDGEAGVAACMERTFATIAPEQTFDVDALHPRALPSADIVKLDVEGAEADILAHMDLTGVSLVVLEYQNDANRRAIEARMRATGLALDYEDGFAWDELLGYSGYRADLAGDHWGRLFFSRRDSTRLRRVGPPRPTFAAPGAEPPPVATTDSKAARASWRRALAGLLRRR